MFYNCISVSLFMLCAAGCVSGPAAMPLEGPASAVSLRTESWTFPGTDDGHKVVTPHYLLYTTIADAEIVQKLGQLMEGGFEEYHSLVPCVTPTDRPLACYLFQDRRQWAQFTRLKAGTDAPVYLHINRGGYTAGDWYVAYFIGDLGTYSVAAHEGWHQFLARHFKTRPPPFLEEGLACMFEDVQWEKDLPRWDLRSNPARLRGLREAADGHALIPLAQLCSMHAGQIVDALPLQIRGFYAQSWAFARFCREADAGSHRAALTRLLCDCASGRAYTTTTSPASEEWHWDPASARPLLQDYFGQDFGALDREYQAFIQQLIRT